LVKKKDAVLATPAEIQKLKQAEEKKKRDQDVAENAFFMLQEAITSVKPRILAKKHDNGHLFSAIPVADILDAIFAVTKVSLNPSQIEVKTPIKTLGEHIITIKQGEKKVEVRIEVVAK
jgi:ribosomal protein L9